MKNINAILWLLFLSSSINSFGQQKNLSVDEVLKTTEDVLKKQKQISYNTKYTLYSDYSTKEIYEQYKGVFLKKNNICYIKIKNTEFVAYENYGLKINHDEKAIQIRNATNAVFEESPLSVAAYLKVFENKTIKSDKDFYICELRPGKISQLMLSKVIIYIKKSDFSIAKQLLYYVEKMETKDRNGNKIYTTPRLEITFSTRAKDNKKDDSLIKRDNYFTVKGSDIKVSQRFSGYKLFKS
jgi:hypothetical protein